MLHPKFNWHVSFNAIDVIFNKGQANQRQMFCTKYIQVMLLVNPVNQFVTQVSIFAVGTRSSEPTGPRDILISEPTSLAGIS